MKKWLIKEYSTGETTTRAVNGNKILYKGHYYYFVEKFFCGSPLKCKMTFGSKYGTLLIEEI